jgi:phage I-like protein
MEEEELLFELPLDGGPPSEVRLFASGENATSKGIFLFDQQAADAVMARFAEHGKDRLDFDVNHGALKDGQPPEAYKSRGWFKPEVRLSESGPELWASDIEWTPWAKQALTDREFRFHSPAVMFDPDTRRVTKLRNVALTNMPATKNQRPLVLSEDSEPEQEKEQEMKEVLAALSAVDESAALARVAELSEVEGKNKELESELSEAKAELSEIKAAQVKERRVAAVDGLIADLKLRPAQKEFAVSLSEEQFEAFASTLTKLPDPVKEGESKLSEDGRTEGADFDATEYLEA